MNRLANIYYLLALGLGVLHVAYSSSVTDYHAAISEYRSPSAVIDRAVDRTFEVLTFGFYKTPPRGVDVSEVLRAADAANTHATHTAIGFAAASLVFVLLHAWWWFTPTSGKNNFALHLLGVALLCLGIGITAPLLTVSAIQELPLMGEVVLSHESKSILSFIRKLWEEGDWLIGSLVLVFSLLVPIAKLALAIIALLKDTPFARWAKQLAHHLGRWSMADVFVVAVLIAFLTARKAPQTEAAVGSGLYFFAAHTLLAVLASQIMQRGESKATGAAPAPSGHPDA